MIDKMITISCYGMFIFAGMFLTFKIEVVSIETFLPRKLCIWGMVISALLFFLSLFLSLNRDERILDKRSREIE